MKRQRTATVIIKTGVLYLLCAPFASAIPGGTYILKGHEKSIQEIVQADMEKYPDLYKGVSLDDYIGAFKSANQIGQRKLAAGDELVFPETAASLKIKESKAAEETGLEEAGLKARQEGIDRFQQEILPSWTLYTGERIFSILESGIPSFLTRHATDLVDADFAASMQLKSYAGRKLYVVVFETPDRSSQCYYAAFKATDGGCDYYTLEKGISVFGAGEASVLWMMDTTGERVRLGSRSYTDLDEFVNELKQ